MVDGSTGTGEVEYIRQLADSAAVAGQALSCGIVHGQFCGAGGLPGPVGGVGAIRTSDISATGRSRVYEAVRKLAETQLRGRCGAGLGLDDDLWAVGLTSLESVSLILAVEETFGIEFPDDALKRETFATIRRIGDTVTALRGTTGSGIGGGL